VIPVAPPPEPKLPEYDFHHDVYERGEDAIRQLAGLSPSRTWRGRKVKKRVDDVAKVTHAMLREYDHWTSAMPALHRAYGGMCAYLARYIELDQSPTTDHFVALRNATDLTLAYTWSNYRLACSLVNGCKSDFADVLDPFEIGEGWFALDLNSFKTVAGPNAPHALMTAIQSTITRLGLDSPEVAQTRRRAAYKYWQPPPDKPALPLWVLEENQPFVARELRRQGRLRPEDLPPS